MKSNVLYKQKVRETQKHKQKKEVRKMKKFEVYEDNAGGLYLATIEADGHVSYLHDGYEYNPTNLADDIELIKNGADPAREWEGNAENPAELYEELTTSCGVELIADSEGIYPDKMGAAASEAFGIDEEY